MSKITSANKITATLLAMLGFATACDKNNNEQPLEYGCPYTVFHVKGKVVADGSQPEWGIPAREPEHGVPGIEVAIAPQGAPSNYPRNTVYTDAEGNFDFALESCGFPAPDYDVWLNDVDGPANGLYSNRTTILTLLQDGWSSTLTQEGIVFWIYPYDTPMSGVYCSIPLTSLTPSRQ